MSPATSAPNSLAIFSALPGAFLLLSPRVYYRGGQRRGQLALLPREQLIGRYLFGVFPDNPAASETHGERHLRTSLNEVLATGRPHDMAPQLRRARPYLAG